MHCSFCALTIDMDLEDLEGIVSVKTSYAKAETEIEFDLAKLDEEQILKIIKKSGYTLHFPIDKVNSKNYYLNNRSNIKIMVDKKYQKIKEELKNRQELLNCAKQLGVVGDPTRIRICYLLCHYPELNVSSMAKILNTSVSVVSHSIKKLLDLKLVQRRKDAQTVYYSLNRNDFTTVLKGFIT